jgi:hypothetical protein
LPRDITQLRPRNWDCVPRPQRGPRTTRPITSPAMTLYSTIPRRESANAHNLLRVCCLGRRASLEPARSLASLGGCFLCSWPGSIRPGFCSRSTIRFGPSHHSCLPDRLRTKPKDGLPVVFTGRSARLFTRQRFHRLTTNHVFRLTQPMLRRPPFSFRCCLPGSRRSRVRSGTALSPIPEPACLCPDTLCFDSAPCFARHCFPRSDADSGRIFGINPSGHTPNNTPRP